MGYLDNKNGHGHQKEKMNITEKSGGENTTNAEDQSPGDSKASGSSSPSPTMGRSLSQYPNKNRQYSNGANSVHSYSQNAIEQTVNLEFEPLDLSQPHLRPQS